MYEFSEIEAPRKEIPFSPWSVSWLTAGASCTTVSHERPLGSSLMISALRLLLAALDMTSSTGLATTVTCSLSPGTILTFGLITAPGPITMFSTATEMKPSSIASSL